MKDGLNVPEFTPIPVPKKNQEQQKRTWKEVTLDGWEKACPWVMALITVFALFMAMITY